MGFIRHCKDTTQMQVWVQCRKFRPMVYPCWIPVKINTRQIKPNQGIWWQLRHIEEDSKMHWFSLTQMLELTGFSHTSDFFQQNQIYTSKWYNNYNIVLHCSMYRGLIFLLMPHHFPFGQVPSSINSKLFFFLSFTCLCLFFWSVVIPRSLSLWT